MGAEQEETEFNFTLEDASAGNYEFAVGARINEDATNGIYVEFKRDSANAFFNVWAGNIGGEWIEAKTQFFNDGHNYTIRLAIDGVMLKVTIIDNTSEQTILKYEKDLTGYKVEETGGFIFKTRKNVTVACVKPHAITVEQEVKQTVIGNVTIGDTNVYNYIHLNIGKGQIPSGIISPTNNLSYAEGTFGTQSTWTTASNYGLMHIGTNEGGTSTITNAAYDKVAMSISRSVVGIGRQYSYDELKGYNDSNTRLYVDGNLVVTGDAASGSDLRFKDVIENKTIRIDDIANAPLFSFKWNDRDDDSIHLGTSAQYWESIAPELVSGKDFKTLNYASLGVAMGIALAKKNINHEERIKILEDEIKVLNQELRRIKDGICN